MAHGGCTVSPLHLRLLEKSSSSVRATFTSLLTPPQQPALAQEAQALPPRHPPAPDRQGQRPALCPPHSGGLSGRSGHSIPAHNWHFWIKPQQIPEAIDHISPATRAINLELQLSEIQFWTASCVDSVPPASWNTAKPTLKRLGAHLRTAGDSDSSTDVLGERPTINTATRRFQNISATMLELNRARLRRSTTRSPCAWVQPGSTPPAHHFRAGTRSQEFRYRSGGRSGPSSSSAAPRHHCFTSR